MIEKGKAIASHVLEAAPADIEFANGRFVIAGTDRSIGDHGAGRKTARGTEASGRRARRSLDVSHATDGVPSAFPNGCHVAEVEIDPDTGVVEVVKYSSVNDFGTIVNPLLVEGQVHGGVVQGIGQVLLENAVYDDEGQLLTGSFMDYAMPRAHHSPRYRLRQPSGAGENQSARHQGLRRSRLRRRARLRDECDRGCAVGLRHPAYRYAGVAGAGVESDPNSEEVARVMIAFVAATRFLGSERCDCFGPAAGRQRHRLRVIYPAALATSRATRHHTPDLRSCIFRHHSPIRA